MWLNLFKCLWTEPKLLLYSSFVWSYGNQLLDHPPSLSCTDVCKQHNEEFMKKKWRRGGKRGCGRKGTERGLERKKGKEVERERKRRVRKKRGWKSKGRRNERKREGRKGGKEKGKRLGKKRGWGRISSCHDHQPSGGTRRVWSIATLQNLCLQQQTRGGSGVAVSQRASLLCRREEGRKENKQRKIERIGKERRKGGEGRRRVEGRGGGGRGRKERIGGGEGKKGVGR